MSNAETRLIDTIFDDDGTPYAETWFSPTNNTTRAMCVAPPATTIPVVFVPGVMGSNLKAKEEIDLGGGKKPIKQGERIWNVETTSSPLGWAIKNAAYRQAVMNHEMVEIDNSGEIGQGTQLDPTHRGRSMPPRIPTGATPRSNLPIKEAQKRGWGSPGWGFYGEFLDWLEYHLNKGRLVAGKPDDVFQRIAQLAGHAPDDVKACAVPLTEQQTRKTLDIHMPVYAVGYNWLQSNTDSGRELMEGVGNQTKGERVLGINEIIERENGKPGQVCNQVIVVTHSMGGLVGRAAALKYDDDNKILGMIHGVQPIDGAAAFYKNIAAGFVVGTSGIKDTVVGYALGQSAREAIPELAYNPGPLELAPNKHYNGGNAWLFVTDRQGNKIELPQEGDPYEEIYMDTENAWRAVNPEWLDPAGKYGNALYQYMNTVQTAQRYHDPEKGGIATQLHPQTFAHWGDDANNPSWGTLTWTAETGQLYVPSPSARALSRGQARRQWIQGQESIDSAPKQWRTDVSVSQTGRERFVTDGAQQTIRMTVAAPIDTGDGTVPAKASAAQIADYSGCQMACAMEGFDHQGDFNNDQVRDVVLDAIVRLVEPVEVSL